MEKISVIGAGSWGTTLAILLGEKGYKVTLWSRRKELADEINSKKENKQYLPNIKIPENVKATNSVEEAVKNCKIIIFAVPSQFLRDTAKMFSSHIPKSAIIVHVAKGIEEKTGKFMSIVLQEELKSDRIAVLSGPNHAKEVSKKLPTATVIASKNEELNKQLCKVFTTPYFFPYPHHDVFGVEICGAAKNIVALAIGVCDGIKFGDNAKGSILTLGLSEMSVIARAFGASRATCFGLAGVGDLVATCFSKHSRNRFVGEMLGKGKTMEQIKKEMHGMIAEGIKNTKAIHELCERNNIKTKLITQSYKVLYQRMDLKKAIDELLKMV